MVTKRPRRNLQKQKHGDTLIGALARLYSLPVSEIAERVGVTKTAVLGWCNGTNRPRAQHEAKLSAIFGGLPISTLTKRVDNPSKMVLLIDPKPARCPKCRHSFDVV